MVSKIAIGVAAAAIALAGATSGTLAQGPASGEAGAKASGPAHGAAGAPAHGEAGGGAKSTPHHGAASGGGEPRAMARESEAKSTPHEAMGKAREPSEAKSTPQTGLTPGEVKKEEQRDKVIDHMSNRDARNDARKDAIKSIPGRENRKEALQDEKDIEKIPGRANRQEARVEARQDRVMRHEFHVTHHGAREPAREERGHGGGRVNIHLGGHPGYGHPGYGVVGPSHRQVVEHRYSFGGPPVRRGLGRTGVRIKTGGGGYGQRVLIKTGGGGYGQQKIKIKIGH
jgi:hypothetical protein